MSEPIRKRYIGKCGDVRVFQADMEDFKKLAEKGKELCGTAELFKYLADKTGKPIEHVEADLQPMLDGIMLRGNIAEAMESQRCLVRALDMMFADGGENLPGKIYNLFGNAFEKDESSLRELFADHAESCPEDGLKLIAACVMTACVSYQIAQMNRELTELEKHPESKKQDEVSGGEHEHN